MEDRRKGGRDYLDRDRKKFIGEKIFWNFCFVLKESYIEYCFLYEEMNIFNFNSNWKRWLFLLDERLGKKLDFEELLDFKNRFGKFMFYGCEIVKKFNL